MKPSTVCALIDGTTWNDLSDEALIYRVIRPMLAMLRKETGKSTCDVVIEMQSFEPEASL